MRRRKFFIIIGALLLVLGAFAFFPSREPSYEGRSLSEWVDEYYETTQLTRSYLVLRATNPAAEAGDLTERTTTPPLTPGEIEASRRLEVARKALSQIGLKAMPCLLDWMAYEQPRWSVRVCDYLKSHIPNFPLSKGVQKLLKKPSQRAMVAPEIFREYAAAEEAIPRLTALLNNRSPEIAARPEECLAAIGPKGLPPLLTALANPSRTNRYRLVSHIGSMRTNAMPAVPALLRTLRDPDPTVSYNTYWALNQIKPRSEVIIPEIIHIVADPKFRTDGAIGYLATFGPAASNAVPALEQALTDPNPDVRSAATNALKRIAAP